MKLSIDRTQVVNTSVSSMRNDVNDLYYERMRLKRGEHYKFLTWLSAQLQDSVFYDLGTRAGCSAMCLGSNRSNKVISYDVTDELKKKHGFKFDSYPNIEFRLKDINAEPIETFLDGTVILLDIDHSGKSEKKFVDNLLASTFNGILIMDDINFHKFKRLKKVFDDIQRPKYILGVAHYSGTGIIPFGDWEIEIV